MTVRFMMDVHVPRQVTNGLRLRSVEVLTAQEDGAERLPDPALLDRATALGRILVSQDEDLLHEATQRQSAGEEFAGVVFAKQGRVSIGQMVQDLSLIAEVCEPADLANQLEYLPL
ncbi:MAG: DUF5615 family PIN-like protein [Roseiflexaceae bacterium]